MTADYRVRYYRVTVGSGETILVIARNMARAEEKVRAMGLIPVYIVEDL